MKIQVTTGYRCKGLPCIQQETLLLHGTDVIGYHVFKAFLYATAVKGYHVFLLQVVYQKWKPQIDGWFLNILHI